MRKLNKIVVWEKIWENILYIKCNYQYRLSADLFYQIGSDCQVLFTQALLMQMPTAKKMVCRN